MPNNSNPNPTSAATKPAVHDGTFAEGHTPPITPRKSTSARSPRAKSHPADYPEEEHVGTFAEGESHPADYPEEEHVGTFAEGEVPA